MADAIEDEAVADACPEQRQELPSPEPRIVHARNQAAGRENARAHGVTHAEARERILDAGLLADHTMATLHGGAWSDRENR